MPINSTNYISSAQCIADTTTTSSTSATILSAATAIATGIAQDGNKKVSVPTLNDLPNLGTCAIGSGHIVYVDAINVPVVSGIDGWYALDGRRARKDVPDRRLWMWGNNGNGRLGDNTTTSKSSPVTTAGGGTNWCQLGLGGYSSAAIKTDGTLWNWGNGRSGQLGTNNTTCYSSPVTTAGGGTNWCQVAKGFDHGIAIKTDGTLWAWGYNGYGSLGTGDITDRCSPVTTVAGGTNWCQTSLFLYMGGIAVKTDGTLWTWGRNHCGQLGTGNTTSYSSPVTVAGGGTNWCYSNGGYFHSGAIKTDGTLWMWGNGGYGRLGTGNTTNYSSPVTTIGGGTNWCRVSGGICHTGAIKTDGTLWMWGRNTEGQVGTGNTTNYSSPVTVAGGGTNWCVVNSGLLFSTAIKTDGTLWVWGHNASGQLGVNDITNRSSPVTTVAGGTNWCNVDTGYNFTAALTSSM